MFEDDDSVFAAMRAGARGYLIKGADAPDVLRAITAVAQGEAIFGPSVAGRVLGYLTRPLSAQDERVFPELTQREREILSLIAEGQTNGRIASTLSLSSKTIRNNVSSIFSKLQVADRAEAIVRARRAGLGVVDGEPR
jgi:DNA-binding NarL/FixJ family response regulator